MTSMRFFAWALLACLAPMTGHAYKLTPESTAMRVPPASTAGQAVTIFVLDHRPYVTSGAKPETFEGVSRELYGIPIDRDTHDDTRMADYLGRRLDIGFDRAGYAATYVPAPKAGQAEALLAAQPVPAGGWYFVVELRDWRYDFGGFRPSFKHDTEVRVFNAEGVLLAREIFGGMELMPQTPGWKSFKTRYAELYQNIFDKIFSAPAIAGGMAGTSTLPASAQPETVETRLARLRKLLEDGLINQDAHDREQARILGEL
jgi:hypothetical protein